MTQEAINNGKVLLLLDCSRKDVEQLQKIINSSELLKEILNSPVVSLQKKEAVLDKIMKKAGIPECLTSFMKVMCRHKMTEQMEDIFESYYEQWDQEHETIRVDAAFASAPSEKEKEEVRSYMEQRFPGWNCICQFRTEPGLLGGYRLRYGNIEYDRSIQNRLQHLERIISS